MFEHYIVSIASQLLLGARQLISKFKPLGVCHSLPCKFTYCCQQKHCFYQKKTDNNVGNVGSGLRINDEI